jgi:hypothetical protein
MGVATVPTVMRDGVIKKHIVIRGDFAWALTSEDDAVRASAEYLLVHELLHVALLQLVDETLPGSILRPLTSPYEAILYGYVDGAVETYLVARRSARLLPSRSNDLRRLVEGALSRACESIPAQRRAYAQDRNLELLASTAMNRIGELILFTAECLGHSDGLGESERWADNSLQTALREADLERWAQRLHHQLQGLWDRRGRWDSYGEFLAINRSLERALWQFKIITWEVEGDAPMYVLVLFDEMVPASSRPPN